MLLKLPQLGRQEFLEILGSLTVAAGLWWIWPPLALIGAGLGMVFLAQGLKRS